MFALANGADQANGYLKKAIESGCCKSYARQDEDLDNLRKTADYQALFAATASK